MTQYVYYNERKFVGMKVFTLFRTDTAGNAKNTAYPIRAEISDAEALREALTYDHVCALYTDFRRSEANFVRSDVIPMDCDNDHSEDPAQWKTPDDVKMAFPDVCFGVGFSRNNMKPKNGKVPRLKFHVYFPIKPITDAKQYAALKQMILTRFPWFDANAADAARFYFGSSDNRAIIVEGSTTVDRVLPKPIPAGSRNSELSKIAGHITKRYGDTEEGRLCFLVQAARCVPPLPANEVNAIWRSAVGYGAREAAKPGYIPPEEYNKPSGISEFLNSAHPESNREYPWSDIGDGRLFADCFKAAVRFVPEKKSWFKYEGGVWMADTGNLFTMERCKELADELIRYALTIADERKKQDYLKHANRWQSRNVRDTILRDAQSVHPIGMSEFDADPDVLNCLNGTLHLDTMAFTPHSSEDKLTKIAGAEYHPEARSERFERFIGEIMSGDDDEAVFLQKAFGYALGGDTRYECLFVLYGATTRNGKGTLCESILKVMGSYGCTVRPETISVKQNVNSQNASEDIARLAGVRFANISEPGRGLMLNAALVKSMTGNDTLNARFLHENSFDFRPQFKIFINTNYLPVINDMTLFTSGRVVILPFNRHFDEDEQDRDLKKRFERPEERSAILNWLIEGRQRLRKEGFKQPEAVKRATDDYMQDSNKIQQFVQEALTESPTAEVKTAAVYERYRLWCSENGCYAESSRNFNQELRSFARIEKKRPRGSNSVTSVLIGYTIDGQAQVL